VCFRGRGFRCLKNRPGQLVTLLCRPAFADRLTGLLFRETTTLGVRRSNVKRQILQRELVEVETSLGTIRMKVGRLNGQIVNSAPEYEDCRLIAASQGVPLKDVLLEAAFQFQRNGDCKHKC
jgi:pyridinium-3,5-bisthiocarboxylic acid mononucleotide nickel chelatase